MDILLNNRKESIDKDEITLAELIVYKKFTFKLLVTKVNGQLIRKDVRSESIIRDGDVVVPGGEHHLQVNDHLILITLPEIHRQVIRQLTGDKD